MVQFNFSYDPSISLEQRVGFELASLIWSSYLTDDVEINLHIASSDSLGEDGQAVGGAIPIFHEQNYGIYQEYAEADVTSEIDASAIEHLQEGNTVDFLIDGQVVDDNTNILLTSAQAKALGMDEVLTLDSGGTWDRDLVDANALDGYILVSNAFEWNYDYTRSSEAPEGTLDFMSMALHEIGHQLGFVSGLDGALDLTQLYSGETQAEGFTTLDLFRHSLESGDILNPDGAVSDLTVGQNSFFSVDGGETNLGNFSDGEDYQASHWARLQVAMGIMDPTLAYQERTSLGELDLQALDVLGWDVNYAALDTGLDLDALLLQAEQAVAEDLGLESTLLTENRADDESENFYTLGYGELWQLFEKSMLALGYGELWQQFELSYGELWQEYGKGVFDLGYGELWQLIEENIFNLGYGELWQQFETEMFNLGYGELWQQFETKMLELGYGQLWQKLDKFFATVDKGKASTNQQNADGGVGGKEAKVFRGGENDDIIAGDKKQDRIKAGAGDDLIDGKGGHDVIWGEAGADVMYGHDGNDLIYGGNDNDLILGENHDDELHGEAGHDIVNGGSGDDIVTGGEGKDDLKGGSGHDVIDGGDGKDRLAGEAGSDILIGGGGQDQLNGGSGDDVLYGDTFEGSSNLKTLRTQLQSQVQESESSHEEEPATSSEPLNPIRVEAESMTLTGDAYVHTGGALESGDIVRTTGTSTSTMTFAGASGNYMVVARYYDAADGEATLDFSLNGIALNSFNLNQNTDHYFTQTVSQNLTLKAGDELVVAATSNGSDGFDYLEFVPLDNVFETPLESVAVSSDPAAATVDAFEAVTASAGEGFRVEAESMTLVGDYSTEYIGSASNTGGIKASARGEGKALTSFLGESGYYNIVVGYYDENDGVSSFSVGVNGTELDSWLSDQSLGSSVATSETFVTRTAASTVFLQEGDLFELTGRRGDKDLARIDYVDFIKVDFTQDATNGNGSESTEVIPGEEVIPSEPVVTGEAIRVEAESMGLNGYATESKDVASNNSLVKTNSSGTATTTFSGDTGYYNIVVAYYDENDGIGSLSASLDGVELDEWQLDQDLGSNKVSQQSFVTRTIATQIQVSSGDEFKLTGIREGGEYALVDYVEFVPVSEPAVALVETTDDDFLQGGTGNDTVYGGEGHDVLYGDSQNDNSSHFFQGSQTYNGHTYLLSEKGTWEQAQIQAQQLGGNLVTLNDAAEESWIRNIFSSTERLWTGFSDAVTEGEWQWVSGEAVTYTNWAPGEPNNDGSGQDFGTINYHDRWDDMYLNGWGGGFQGIIEINTTDNDILIGGEGDDKLYGNAGDDQLYGDDLIEESDNTLIEGGINTNLGEVIRIEAESMSLNGYSIESKDVASNKSLAKTNSSGTATTEFAGDTGYYNIVVAYYDENDGIGSLSASLDGVELDEWNLDQDLGSDKASQQNLVTRTIATQIQVSSGDTLQLTGIREGGEYVLVDYVEFVAVSEPVTPVITTANDDFLEGGSGNDTLFGGIGSDTLEGSDAITVGYLEQDILDGGLGADTFILGNATQLYYQGGGDRDFATIQDFNASEDLIQLHGSADNYSLQQQDNDTYLYEQSSTPELVAVLKNVSGVNFSTGFSFV